MIRLRLWMTIEYIHPSPPPRYPSRVLLLNCLLDFPTVLWRIVVVPFNRWHQGAVQLAMWKGWKFAMGGETWGAFFQKASKSWCHQSKRLLYRRAKRKPTHPSTPRTNFPSRVSRPRGEGRGEKRPIDMSIYMQAHLGEILSRVKCVVFVVWLPPDLKNLVSVYHARGCVVKRGSMVSLTETFKRDDTTTLCLPKVH